MGIGIRQYVEAVAAKIEDAAAKGNKEEVIRLLRLLRDVAEEQAVKLEKE